MQVKNNMENFVAKKLDTVLKQYPDVCRCDKCRKDIMVWALNHLPPKYVNSRTGEVLVRFKANNFQDDAEIIQAIASAVEIVAQHPHHNRIDD